MTDTKNNALDAKEVAEILNISKNTVYELIKRGEINSYKVGRKVRFTKDDIDHYIASSKSIKNYSLELRDNNSNDLKNILPINNNMIDSANKNNYETLKTYVISGQELILDVLSHYIDKKVKGFKTLRSYSGCYDSLIDLYKGDSIASLVNLYDSDSDEYNISYIRRFLPGIKVKVIHLTTRMQGLYVKENNPKHIIDWIDFNRKDIRMINREKGSASRILLDEMLYKLNISSSNIDGYSRESSSPLALATTIARGGADVGVGTELLLGQVKGIIFLPLQKESYDLVIKNEDLSNPYIKLLLEIINSSEFKEEFSHLSGYDISNLGREINI